MNQGSEPRDAITLTVSLRKFNELDGHGKSQFRSHYRKIKVGAMPIELEHSRDGKWSPVEPETLTLERWAGMSGSSKGNAREKFARRGWDLLPFMQPLDPWLHPQKMTVNTWSSLDETVRDRVRQVWTANEWPLEDYMQEDG